MAIPAKKTSHKEIAFLSQSELNTYLNLIDTNSRKGLRDYTLVVLMYDSAARVQEIINLSVNDLKLDEKPSVTLYGKGNKYRSIPITNNTKELLMNYIKLFNLNNFEYLFSGNDKKQATTKMITHIIKKYANKSNINKNIHPHVFRHSRAMHLLEAGISLVDIRDILGHVSVTTTEIYAKTNIELKRKAILDVYDSSSSIEVEENCWNKDTSILEELLDL
ncbi:MAG: tyrosine-type recombinase/integrase [bacterium]|nr:tyrosine-type recombinase/integrase [bacterium]